MFKNIYNNKKVLITGNTGFKGSWLSLWLQSLGAKIYGISIDIPTKPSNYEVSSINDFTLNHFFNINEYQKLLKVVKKIKPDFIFHLAAQPKVQISYTNPLDTMQSNIMGTVNLLEVLRVINHKCTAVFITSDKCYNNTEWVWGYKETDELGGKDPYSASKGAAELMIKTYFHSYFNKKNSNVKIASGRAGNVIGGGDWAPKRIIPDAITAWSKNKELIIRSPNATRPWQHVLEPLSGYLRLGQILHDNNQISGESFNFGPNPETNFTVEELLVKMSKYWNSVKWKVQDEISFNEAGLLKLNCDKAQFYMSWVPNLNSDQTIEMLVKWYKKYYSSPRQSMFDFTLNQIKNYEKIAVNNNLSWTE